MNVNWGAVGATAEVVAAIVAAVAAVAAWKAAIHSERTSRQTSEALTLIERPTVKTSGIYAEERGERVVGTTHVGTSGSWDARDVHVEARRRDGSVFRGHTDWLRVGASSLRVELGEFPPAPEGYAGLEMDSVYIRFADHRGTAIYERHEDYSHLTQPPCVPLVTEGRIS